MINNMYLSDKTIKEYLKSGKIVVQPEFDEKNIRSAGIRVHLDDKILLPKPGQTISLQNPTELEYDEHFLKQEAYTIKPGEFLLASTLENVQMDRGLIAFVDGRSTIARLGLTVHVTSTTIDGNYDEARATTLEMKNVGNFAITLNYKDPVGMMVFAELKESVEQSPQSQYQGQHGVAAPNMSFKPGEDK